MLPSLFLFPFPRAPPAYAGTGAAELGDSAACDWPVNNGGAEVTVDPRAVPAVTGWEEAKQAR